MSTRWNGVDPFSSAWWFDGWKDDTWRHGLSLPSDKMVATARSWLLAEGWRRRGLIAVDEVPPAARPRGRQALTPGGRWRARAARSSEAMGSAFWRVPNWQVSGEDSHTKRPSSAPAGARSSLHTPSATSPAK